MGFFFIVDIIQDSITSAGFTRHWETFMGTINLLQIKLDHGVSDLETNHLSLISLNPL